MSDFKNKLSYLVAGQLPAYIREEYPKFVAFLEEYYKFLETSGQAHDILLNSEKWSDVETTLDEFIPLFLKQYAYDIPQNALIDNKRIIKYIHSYYESKGSENAAEMFFRFMYNDEIAVVYPGDNILRASDGRWSRKRYIKVDTQLFTSVDIFSLKDKLININYVEFVDGIGSVLRSLETKCINVFGQAEANIYQIEVDLDPSYVFPKAERPSTAQILGTGNDGPIESLGVYETFVYVVYDGVIYGSLSTQLVGVSSIDSPGSSFREDDAFQIEEIDYGTASSGSSSTLVDNTKGWGIDVWKNYTVSITAGAGAGETKTITGNTSDTLSVSDDWDETPNNTSKYRIDGRNSNAIVRVSGTRNLLGLIDDGFNTIGQGISTLQIVDTGFRFIPARLVAGEAVNYFAENYTDGVGGDYVSDDIAEVVDGKFTTSIFPTSDLGTPATVTFDLGLVYEAQGSFKDSSGFLSDVNNLQDNYYYQPYSYVIRTTQPQQNWVDVYNRSNHPSGFKMFSELQFIDSFSDSITLSDSFRSNDYTNLFDAVSFSDSISFSVSKIVLPDAYVLGGPEGPYFEYGEDYIASDGSTLSDSITF